MKTQHQPFVHWLHISYNTLRNYKMTKGKTNSVLSIPWTVSLTKSKLVKTVPTRKGVSLPLSQELSFLFGQNHRFNITPQKYKVLVKQAGKLSSLTYF